MANASSDKNLISFPSSIVDTHVHFAEQWRCGEQGLPNAWLRDENNQAFHQDWSEDKLTSDAKFSALPVNVLVYVECFNTSNIDEAKWVLSMINDEHSLVQAFVAHIPVPDGADAVTTFLNELRNNNDSTTSKSSIGSLPRALKGGRVVLLGNPTPSPTSVLQEKYIQGLKALHAEGLHWEWCCNPNAIPAITEVCKQLPDMLFILDHLGHNQGGNDFDEWQQNISILASSCPNIIAKMGAIEEWSCDDPAPFLDHAIMQFGYDRCMYEGNWFVSAAMGEAYDASAQHLLQACQRLGATQDQVNAVFRDNAKRIYLN
jgi:L-fuconolactonase